MTQSIVQYIGQESIGQNIKQVLKDKTPQFIASVSSLVASNEKLKECDNGSILRACLVAASLDLPINQNLGFAFIIPYKENKKIASTGENGKEIVTWSSNMVAQFQMGWRGFVQLAQRSGQFKTINTSDVKEGEILSQDRLTGEIKFKWIVDDRDSKKTIGYVAFFELTNGFEKMLYMTVDQLKAHGVKFSKTYKFGPWADDFDSMAKKTVLKLLLSKYAPMTVDMQQAQLADQAIVKDDGYEYADNTPVDHEVVSQDKENARVLAHIAASKTMEELCQCESAVTDATRSAYLDKQCQLEDK